MTEEQIERAARKFYWESTGNVFAENSRPDRVIGFYSGAKWALEQQAGELHKALKGLGLEKHSIALNVLRIAGIKLPEPPTNSPKNTVTNDQ